ncbi:hypothetical protein [Sutcliffiella rhizosphaerae]|uniref:Uncharacterized protein n=1 Tax=Sutcliffiella rhizosphaerae TaxID=2880967 RepID=A0ABN8A5F2_9BACI|nr:hypothetical protein [Sutcliffiella rhizosphaerae]CAG9620326.1 hypothetical protein BACCIP111883_01094 [Sutcliffiella rhizosphaerae]
MGIYKTVCYKVEDVFVKLLSKKQDSELVKEKVSTYRTTKENASSQKKESK